MTEKAKTKRKRGTKKNNVTLREKKLANGNTSLYLDIYRDGQRSYEFLKLYLNSKARTPIDKEVNNANRERAERIRTDREKDLNDLAFGYIPTSFTNQFQCCFVEVDNNGLSGFLLVKF